MAKPLTLTLLLLLAAPLVAVADEEPAAGAAVTAAVEDYDARARLPETVVTVTRGPRQVFDVPRAVTIIDSETLHEQMPAQLVKTMTMRDPGILMDMRTYTTGDPVMRGFAGFNLLALIDGNTLSTLWGEGGDGADDMYGKIDPDTIERIEIVRGPNSVLYGSNALGGVFNFITRSSPIDYTEDGFAWGGRIRTTYTSVNKGIRGRFEGYGATPDLKFLVGYTRADYDDGRRGGDGMTLRPSGGRESNFDVRADWAFNPGNELSLTVQNVTRWNLGRYYRPTQSNRNERLGIAATWKADELFDGVRNFKWRLYYQKKRDERTISDTGQEGFAQTDTYSTDLTASSDLGGGHYLTYGIHVHRDDGQSPDDEQFTFTTPAPTLADGPDSEWANYGAYLQDEWSLAETVTLTVAGRYDYFVFESLPTAEYLPGDPNRNADFSRSTKGALTGGIGLSWEIAPEWRILASYSRGFHQIAPAFGTVQKGLGVQVPSPLLDPITSDNFELGVRCRYPAFQGEGFVYYTKARDWADYRRGTYNGQDWFDYNKNGAKDANEDVFTYQNVDSAHIEGIELKGTVYLPQAFEGFPAGWSVWGGFAVNQGKLDNGDEFRHTQPARGIIGIRWDDSDPDRAAYFEFVTEMVAKYDRITDTRKQSDLAYKEDPQNPGLGLLRSYGGVPGYTVFSAYAGMNICESARVNLGIENITDKKFRRAHSRMDAFGINVIIGLDITF